MAVILFNPIDMCVRVCIRGICVPVCIRGERGLGVKSKFRGVATESGPEMARFKLGPFLYRKYEGSIRV